MRKKDYLEINVFKKKKKQERGANAVWTRILDGKPIISLIIIFTLL